MQQFSIRRAATLLSAILASFAVSAQEATPRLTGEQIRFFEKNIRPLLVENCYSCHGTKSEKGGKGGLFVDTREGLLRGGSSGPALIPGNAGKSLLIKAVRYEDDDLQMPPKDKKLPDEQIALLEQWVQMGAPDPRVAAEGADLANIDLTRARDHWAFKPMNKPPVPKLPDEERWGLTAVDAFILAKLQENKLQPSPAADRRTLIRRATYDLTGLPPSPQEVEDFLKDASPTVEAFAKVVDRLLDSPHYGERWGRHWLDVARYADTTGDRNNRGDTRYPYAWTYRDYVVNAFNNDLPFDQFILEQIAADKLQHNGDNRSLAALGFLTVGKRFMNNANDVIDDRIDVVSQGFLGLTVSCARCHDHKFDPIPTRDYYSLHGVFNSTVEPEDKPVLGTWKETEAYQDYLHQLVKIDEEAAEFRQKELTRLNKILQERLADYLLAEAELNGPNDPARTSIARKGKLEVNLLEVLSQNFRQERRSANPILSPWFAFAAVQEENFSQRAAQIQGMLQQGRLNGREVNPAVAEALAVAELNHLSDVAEVYGKLCKETGEPELLSSNMQPESEAGEGLDRSKQISGSRGAVREAFLFGSGALQLDNRQARRLLGNQVQNRETQIKAKKVALHINHPGSPPRAMVLQDTARPRNSRVLIRGERGNLGPEVPRQFLEILSGPERKPFLEGSGRLELARAIADPANPLTARVIVNRVWQQHFGQGIVRSSSDFGLRAEPPTHPELLDYLSAWFVENGWSLRKLHRLLMLSHVYQQQSLKRPEAEKVDPENKYLWKMNLRRLEFEAIRDTLLSLGGKMDSQTGGPPFSISELASSKRRTLYATVDRLSLPENFRVFDFANPDMSSSQRYLTTVPQQALFFMNSQIVAEQARNLVARPEIKGAADEALKIEGLFKLVYQRKPDTKEIGLAMEFLQSQEPVIQTSSNEGVAPQKRRQNQKRMPQASNRVTKENNKPLGALERYAQVLLQGNELIFIR